MVDTTPVTSRVKILFLFLCRSSDDLEQHPIWMITMSDDFGIINLAPFMGKLLYFKP